ncbi:UDP-N-acetylmuramoyl-tripeptide--D-alanyl-D-alanine ligase [Nakamurella lactea]|uniref:UDP-N-acetylmuramoyl-tripeptide--D-alanyl-D- alanine ligase n=1 Tax=Nakamurella lactea TaxID=459515 RepID=UPI001FE2174F|nr:UDP-N-acetylmuramoyl-tripeptide--D-alanyl-D-alanine ligase [Nakamurella lactea]
MRLGRIAEITGGTLYSDGAQPAAGIPVTGVVTDSRKAEQGSLYVARVGEHADGHDFAAAAAANGALSVLGSRPVDGMPTVVVEDVQAAFAALARAVADAAVLGGLQIVGITGSSGKTSTKDLLGQLLGSFGPTVAPEGSYNSEVGVPLTVCRVDTSTRFLVAEMGAAGVGHIHYLTSIAPPRIGIVLNVGSAHVGEFGSVEAIARTKAELVQALPSAERGGLAVLNADDARVLAMREQTAARVLTVGLSDTADLRATEVQLDDNGRAGFTLTGVLPTPGGDREIGGVRIALGFHGAHQVGNALAAIATAGALGMSLRGIVNELRTATPISRWRMEVHELPTGVLLINDAYNANPESMAAALRALAQLGRGRRTIAVLGEMRELGDSSADAHRAVGTLAGELGVRRLLAVGPGTAGIAEGALSAGVPADEVQQVPGIDEAHDLLRQLLTAGDVVLFKSSRDSGLRYLGDRITTASGGEIPT